LHFEQTLVQLQMGWLTVPAIKVQAGRQGFGIMAEKLRWGILATGNIARKFATGLAHSQACQLVAIASRQMELAQAFGLEFHCDRCYGSYQALLADAEVDAVYISTPHPLHAQWAIAAAQAGKHILCEKPIGMNHAQALAIIQAARANDVFLMEAYMYRCHPQTARLVELLRAKAIGEVRTIQAAFSFHAAFNANSRVFDRNLGGGGILDVGGYPVSMARMIAGLAVGGDFAEPLEVQALGHLGQTGVDEWTSCTMKFPGDILASLACGVGVYQDPTVRIFGTGGWIAIPQPWIPAREGGTVKILLQQAGRELEEIVIQTPEFLFGIEADVVAASIQNRQGTFPAMTWDDTLGNMQAMDQWRKAIGLAYETDKP
jgi:predicted dehydrogenase